MFKNEILENKRRRKIHRFLQENPGVHLRGLQRSLKIPLSSLEYHINYLLRKNILFKEKDGRSKRYYVNPLNARDRRILSTLRQKRMRDIVLLVLSKKKATHKHLLKNLHLPPSTLSFYLKHLINRQILKRHKIGRQNIYTVQDENRVTRVLLANKTSLTDKFVDRVLGTWMETRFRILRESENSRGENAP